MGLKRRALETQRAFTHIRSQIQCGLPMRSSQSSQMCSEDFGSIVRRSLAWNLQVYPPELKNLFVESLGVREVGRCGKDADNNLLGLGQCHCPEVVDGAALREGIMRRINYGKRSTTLRRACVSWRFARGDLQSSAHASPSPAPGIPQAACP